MRRWRMTTEGTLPWFLEPLRLQGFLGKLRGASMGFADPHPERWTLDQVLFAVLALASVHEAFVGGARQHWVATCAALHQQKRLSAQDLLTVQVVYEFGRLIGNTDMHFGNLSLYVDDIHQIDNPHFTLAPIYDMLPMVYRPSEFRDEPGYRVFVQPTTVVRDAHVQAKAQAMALDFWQAMNQHTLASKGWRTLALEMTRRA